MITFFFDTFWLSMFEKEATRSPAESCAVNLRHLVELTGALPEAMKPPDSSEPAIINATRTSLAGSAEMMA